MKNENIIKYNFLGRELSLNFIFDVFDNEEVTELQKETYNKVINNMDDIFVKSLEKLKEYCKNNYDIEVDETNLYKYIVPKEIYIKREKENEDYCKIGILCNFKCDIENGIAIVLINNTVCDIGMQDIIL